MCLPVMIPPDGIPIAGIYVPLALIVYPSVVPCLDPVRFFSVESSQEAAEL